MGTKGWGMVLNSYYLRYIKTVPKSVGRKKKKKKGDFYFDNPFYVEQCQLTRNKKKHGNDHQKKLKNNTTKTNWYLGESYESMQFCEIMEIFHLWY